MATLKELRLEAGLSIAQLSRLADVDRKTVERAEHGEPVQDTKAYAIVRALNNRLGTAYRLSELSGLNIL